MSGDYLPLVPIQLEDGREVRYAMLDVIGVEDDGSVDASKVRGINDVAYWLARYRSALRREHDPVTGQHDTPKVPVALIVLPMVGYDGMATIAIPPDPRSYSLDGYGEDAVDSAERVGVGEAVLKLRTYHGGMAVSLHPQVHVTSWDGQAAQIDLTDWQPGANGAIVPLDRVIAIAVYR